MVFPIIQFDALFLPSSVDYIIGCLIIFSADNCLVMVFHIVLIQLSKVSASHKRRIRVSLLEKAIPGIFLISDDAVYCMPRPLSTFLGRNSLCHKVFCNIMSSNSGKGLCKNISHNLCLFRVNHHLAILLIPVISIRRV